MHCSSCHAILHASRHKDEVRPQKNYFFCSGMLCNCPSIVHCYLDKTLSLSLLRCHLDKTGSTVTHRTVPFPGSISSHMIFPCFSSTNVFSHSVKVALFHSLSISVQITDESVRLRALCLVPFPCSAGCVVT